MPAVLQGWSGDGFLVPPCFYRLRILYLGVSSTQLLPPSLLFFFSLCKWTLVKTKVTTPTKWRHTQNTQRHLLSSASGPLPSHLNVKSKDISAHTISLLLWIFSFLLSWRAYLLWKAPSVVNHSVFTTHVCFTGIFYMCAYRMHECRRVVGPRWNKQEITLQSKKQQRKPPLMSLENFLRTNKIMMFADIRNMLFCQKQVNNTLTCEDVF